MKCKYCGHLFDGRMHHCNWCHKDRHYDGPPKVKRTRRRASPLGLTSLGMAVVLPFVGAFYALYKAGVEQGHKDAKEKLEELE